MMRAPNAKRQGFSKVEVLVVMGVITVAVSLLLPALLDSRQTARARICTDRLRQIGLALDGYHKSYQVFPSGAMYRTSKPRGTIPEGDQLTDGRVPWSVQMLPFLEEAPRYHRFDVEGIFSARFDLRSATPEPNRTQQYLPLVRLQCPDDPNSSAEATHSNYAACQGGGTAADALEQDRATLPGFRLFFDNGIFYHNSRTTVDDIRDGLSNTLLVGESKYVGTPRTFGSDGAWWSWAASIRGDRSNPSLFNISATVDPLNNPQNGEYTEQEIIHHRGVFEGAHHGGQQRVYGSWHPGGGYFCFADGAVRFLNEAIDLQTYRRLGTIADGMPEDGWNVQ